MDWDMGNWKEKKTKQNSQVSELRNPFTEKENTEGAEWEEDQDCLASSVLEAPASYPRGDAQGAVVHMARDPKREVFAHKQ